jgi:hypothetical protein
LRSCEGWECRAKAFEIAKLAKKTKGRERLAPSP